MAARVGISGDGAQASFSQEVLKVTETHQTRHHNQQWICQSTYQGCTTKGRAPQRKREFHFWCGRYKVWEKGRLGQSRECLLFLEKSQIQWVCSQPTQWAKNDNRWCLGVSPSQGIKICSETMFFRLSPKLLNATSLKPWYLRYTKEDFLLTSSQKTFSACFSSFLAFRTSCAEEWCNLSEDGRQKMWKAMMAHHHWEIKRYIFSFHHCFPGFWKDLL